jgi:hypothetical protein
MFNNTVKTEWLEGESRKMRLLETVTFTDSNGKVWTAPKGSIIDGASIPRFFWRVIGSPFVGNYRRATVIHDVYCNTRSEPHEDVHSMFLEGMTCDNVCRLKAGIMYEAVDNHGPKWDSKGQDLVVEINDDFDEMGD